MCGIFGNIGRLKDSDMEVAREMLCHRGPDGQVYKTYEPNVHLFHARLSIVDIAGGTQPMDDEDLAIIFNGEIYNHLELRKQFSLSGQTHSDTETILLLYKKLGLDMLEHLEGMFAMALYDKRQGKVYLFRDRAGKKPLYFSKTNDSIYFGSEQNLLQKILRPSIRLSAMAAYLQTGMVYGEATPFEGISEVKPGHFVDIDVRRGIISEQKEWWSIVPFYEQDSIEASDEEALQELDRRLKQAVKRRIESSDLEVGCFLSGGIDSGIVTAMATEVKPGLRTFTVRFSDEYDESPIARKVANHLGTNHQELDVSYDNLLQDFENIVNAYGEPFVDDSQIPSYYVAREARKHLTVIVNGDGGDELFGGYRRYVPYANALLTSGGVKAVSKLIAPLLPAPDNKMTLYNYAYRLAKLNSLESFEQYLSASTDLLLDQATPFKVKPDEALEKKIRSIYGKNISALDKIMLADFETILPYILLKKIDISSMQNSLEGRSPFLSKDIMEFAPTLPDHMKVRGRTTKWLLRKLAAQYLPIGNEKLPKRGFETPIIEMVEKTLQPILQDYLHSSNCLYKDVLEASFVEKLLNDKVAVSKDKRAKILFGILSMEIWYRKQAEAVPA
ncbi:asparagine synthase (glutamine-hydrolyzing) [Pontibacter diazotrophicus]|uniref:asparagine synthase (glutamine-hydrolyzing) n=1 Tax=Pontibacter diazotrophicus TaxID=1400979 RepID=A0A3D8LFH2_9BACT|nr:asparagine synthase (glutamine-hydrolyzing) [Pontibacter diazotrophicus]RDV16138.1 asparagine synthase (glutamine-hydrolyzing) [Pontibacter diazotrophicus]